jgi:Fe2+ transport system protein FeoA
MHVSNSELPTRVSQGQVKEPEFCRLVDATGLRRLRIVAVEPARRAALAQEGLGVGAEIEIERRLAVGGPLILRLGQSRLAIARIVAADVLVEPASADL